jgi:hypothetical protein
MPKTRYSLLCEARPGPVLINASFYVSADSAKDSESENCTIVSVIPNPLGMFRGIVTTQVHQEGFVHLDVINTLGQIVDNIVNEYRQPGTYNDSLITKSMAQGSYLLRLQCNGTTIVRSIQVGGR